MFNFVEVVKAMTTVNCAVTLCSGAIGKRHEQKTGISTPPACFVVLGQASEESFP